MTQTVQCRCGRSFRTEVRNGLKSHRRCPACRKQRPQGTRIHATAPTRRFKRLGNSKRPATSRLRADFEATRKSKFLDSRSYVHRDGRILLFGKDMSLMRSFVLLRDRGCVLCRAGESLELSHRTPRSKGRDDRASNLEILCRSCHRLQHPNQRESWSRR